MASLLKTKPDYPYYVLVFTNAKKKPKQKFLYFKRSQFSKKRILELKIELEIKYKSKEYDPWQQEIEIVQNQYNIRFSDSVNEFLADKQKTLASNTLRRYSDVLKLFMTRNHTLRNVDELNKKVLDIFCNDETISYSTKNSRRTVLHSYISWVHEKKHIPELLRIKIISTKAERRGNQKTWVTSEELELIIKALQVLDERATKPKHAPKEIKGRGWLADLFRVAFYTGMRRGDLMHMKVSWIKQDFIYIGDDHYRPKSQKSIEAVPIMPEIRPILDRLCIGKSRSERLFGHSREDWPSKTFKECVKIALPDKADKLRFHNLRDSAAMYWMYERGLPLHLVQELLRHANIKTTEIYRQYNPRALFDALNTAGRKSL